LKRMPYSAALPVPAIIAAGVARPTAQGHEITSTVTEMRSAKPKTSRFSRLYGVRMSLVSASNQR